MFITRDIVRRRDAELDLSINRSMCNDEILRDAYEECLRVMTRLIEQNKNEQFLYEKFKVPMFDLIIELKLVLLSHFNSITRTTFRVRGPLYDLGEAIALFYTYSSNNLAWNSGSAKMTIVSISCK